MLLSANVDVPVIQRMAGGIAEPRNWSAMINDRLRGLDSPLTVAWAVLSAALAISFISGVAGLAWMRRRWETRVVQGETVYLSRRTGPAIVGVMSPAIVVPEWALSLPASQLSLMLRHEREHLRARDGQLLIAAQLALIVMPWNLALWWQVLSLRVAIEMDCDARVLRVADARSYGELLLEVARPHRTFKLAGMIAFAERASQLERRIRFLKRHRVAPSRRATIAASTVALIALSAAWVAPHPTLRVRSRVVVADPSSLPVVVTRDAPLSMSITIPTARAAAILKRPTSLVARKLAVECANDTTLVGSTYRFLYDGTKLTRDNESKACELLARLVDEQLAEDAVAQATQLQSRSQRMAVQNQRNASLAALLKTDADRATFAANVERMTSPGGGAGGRGRMSGDAPAGILVPMGGGARGGRATITADTMIFAAGAPDALRAKLERESALMAATGGGGRVNMTVRTTNDSGFVNTVARVALDTLSRDPEKLENMRRDIEAVVSKLNQAALFNGISLTDDDAALAQKIIAEARQQTNVVAPMLRPATRLRVNHARGFAQVVAGADTTLVELAPAADRAAVRSRIVTVPQ